MADQINIELLISNVQGAKTLGDLKKSLQEVRKAQDSVGIGSKAFNELNDSLDEGSERIKTFRKGFDGLKEFSIVGQTLASSFSLATSAIAAFGLEGTNAEKALLKVQSALGIVQSFAALRNAIDAAKAANIALNATLLTNPYVLLAAGIGAAILAMVDWNSTQEDGKKVTESLNRELEIQAGILARLSSEVERNQKIELSAAKTNEEKAKIRIKYIEQELKLIRETIDNNATQIKQGREINIVNGRVISNNDTLIKQGKDLTIVNGRLVSNNEQTNKLLEEQNKLIEREKDLKADIVIINNELKNELETKKDSNKVTQDAIDLLSEYNQLLDSQQFGLQILNELGVNQSVQLEEYNKYLDERLLKLGQLEVRAKNEIKDAKNLASELAKITVERDKINRERIVIDLPKVGSLENVFGLGGLNAASKQLNASFRQLLDPISVKIASLNREIDSLGDGLAKTLKEVEVSDLENKFKQINDALVDFQKVQELVISDLEILPQVVNTIFDAVSLGVSDLSSSMPIVLDSVNNLGKAISETFFNDKLDDLLQKSSIDVEAFFGIVKNAFNAFNTQQSNVRKGLDGLFAAGKITYEEYSKSLEEFQKTSDESLNSFSSKIQATIDKISDPAQQFVIQKFFSSFVLGSGLAVEAITNVEIKLNKFLQDFNKGLQYVNTVQNELFKTFELQSQNRITTLENERASFQDNLERQLDADLLTQEQYAERSRQLDEEYNSKLKEAKAEQFRTGKAADVVQAVINTALGVSRALSEGGIIGPVLAGIVGGLGAAQIALIASQPEPQFAEGGLFVGAGGPKDDSNRIRVSNGEYIVNAKATNAFLPLLEAVNGMGNYSLNTLGGSKDNSINDKAVKKTEVIKKDPFKVFVVQSDISKAGKKADDIKTRVTF